MQRNVGTLVIKPLVMTGYTEKKNPRKIYSFTNKDIRLVPCWHWAACRFAFKTTWNRFNNPKGAVLDRELM